MLKERIDNNSGTTTEEFICLKATYHFHVFHYRMPETAAIAAVTPFVPSPLTVKMAMIASLFQLGDVDGAEILARKMHKIEIKIAPPKAAISFKAFLRYRSVPAVESQRSIDETGSYYPSRPHIREYAIFQDNLEIYVKTPVGIREHIEKSLKNIRYIGCKDSMVTCLEVIQTSEIPYEKLIRKNYVENSGYIAVLLADFKENEEINSLVELIPGKRKERKYEKSLYLIPGKIKTIGRTKIFIRNT